jgi:hypothetical protein
MMMMNEVDFLPPVENPTPPMMRLTMKSLFCDKERIQREEVNDQDAAFSLCHSVSVVAEYSCQNPRQSLTYQS